MNSLIKILWIPIVGFIFSNCSQKKSENPIHLIGFVYDSAKEVEKIINFKETGGSVMDIKNNRGDYEYGISRFTNGQVNILTFEKFIYQNDNDNFKNQILDTMTVNLKEFEYISYCNCFQDTTYDSQIIAVVKADLEKEYFTNIHKAWRADTKSGKIIVIKDTKGITCTNPGYGAD